MKTFRDYNRELVVRFKKEATRTQAHLYVNHGRGGSCLVRAVSREEADGKLKALVGDFGEYRGFVTLVTIGQRLPAAGAEPHELLYSHGGSFLDAMEIEGDSDIIGVVLLKAPKDFSKDEDPEEANEVAFEDADVTIDGGDTHLEFGSLGGDAYGILLVG